MEYMCRYWELRMTGRVEAQLEGFRDSFKVDHLAASELRSCCIKVDSISLEINFSIFVSSARLITYSVELTNSFG